MAIHHLYSFRRAPFIKIVAGLMLGILAQWNLQFHYSLWAYSLLTTLVFLLVYTVQTSGKKFRIRWLSGVLSILLIIDAGALLTWNKDVRNHRQWMGNNSSASFAVCILQEPVVEKQNSYKAESRIILYDSMAEEISSGTVLLYLEKDSFTKKLDYGSTILFRNKIQQIRASGNPGAFDYSRYCLFQGITHQVYLKSTDFRVIDQRRTSIIRRTLFQIQDRVLEILRTYIDGKKEIGLAEALLIGYKNDLDKTLVQSYSNTGVVHVIAISGLHIGLIYWLLELLFKPFGRRGIMKWLKPLFVLTGLWMFSLLAGAQPSVLRSAVMFTCIVVASAITRKSSIYNTLAFSAFILLCYNPYWLWDAGFQLSYTAVLSILLFMKPVYNLVFIKNKIIDMIWKLIAVTIAAQILTLPVSIFHFHQFPNYFILTNIVAVPLSSIIVLGEIFLCAVSIIPVIAEFTGLIVTWMIMLMNEYVKLIELLPYARLENMQIDIWQTMLLYTFIATVAFWILESSRRSAFIGAIFLLSFFVIRILSFEEADKQQKLVVYNINKHLAIDIYAGRRHIFFGDTAIESDPFISSFHLKPSRILHRSTMVEKVRPRGSAFMINGKKVFIIQDSLRFRPSGRSAIDILIISGKPRIYFKDPLMSSAVRFVVFSGDASSSRKFWKMDCDSAGIPYHDVSEKGAFVVNLN